MMFASCAGHLRAEGIAGEEESLRVDMQPRRVLLKIAESGVDLLQLRRILQGRRQRVVHADSGEALRGENFQITGYLVLAPPSQPPP